MGITRQVREEHGSGDAAKLGADAGMADKSMEFLENGGEVYLRE